jgi:hypothetical protein
MANCRACGGVLGRDCFHEADCMEISRRDSHCHEFNTSEEEHYISVLIYILEQHNIPVPGPFSVYPPLIMKPFIGCEYNYEDDGLPF